MHRWSALVALLMSWFIGAEVHAWNSVGHLTVVKLAYDELEDGHKTRLFQIARKHPHYESFLVAGKPADASEVEWVLMRASVWPDWIRPRTKDKRGAEVTRFHRGEEHYVNVPFIDPRDEAYFAGKTLVPEDITNIVCSLKQRCNDLHTKNASDEDKAVALCWIFHQVGDIHQPMHNVSYFSRDPAFKNGDLGGNKFGIRVKGRKWKLHAYWDDLLGEDARYTDDSDQRQRKLHAEARAAAERLRGLELSAADQDRLAKNLTIASWSQEGAELARTVAYRKPDGSLLEGVEVQFDGSMPDSAREVGPEYINLAKSTADVRIVLAGKRLATRIKMILNK